MPRGQLPFLLCQKSNPKKATPTIGLILRCSEKSGTKNSLSLRQFFVLIALIFPLLGTNQRGPVGQIFDRFAMSY